MMDERLPSPFSSDTVLPYFGGQQCNYPVGHLSALGSGWTSTQTSGNHSGFWYNTPKNAVAPPTNYPNICGAQFSKNKLKGTFYCESCDRGFDSENKLQEHLQEHVTCGKDGCNFKGHPKIVQNHQRMQHDTGLAKKIMQLNSSDEIQQWREERKKNYPTKENLARKKKEQSEKLARGEVLNIKQFGKMKGMNGHRRGRPNFRDSVPQNRKPYSMPAISEQQQIRRRAECIQNINEIIASDKIPQLKNEKHIGECNKDLSSEEEGEYRSDEEVKDKCVTQGVTVQNTTTASVDDPMSSILHNSNSIIEIAVTGPKVKNESTVVSGGLGSIMNSYISDSEEEECVKVPQIPKASKQAYKPRVLPFRPKKHGSLLMKLLSKEVHRERNMIFQCIRYIVNENYFGVDQK